MVTLVGKRDRVVHVVLSTSYRQCRVIDVSYTYEQCLPIAGLLGLQYKGLDFTRANAQLHLVRVSLVRAHIKHKYNARHSFFQLTDISVRFTQLIACASA